MEVTHRVRYVVAQTPASLGHGVAQVVEHALRAAEPVGGLRQARGDGIRVFRGNFPGPQQEVVLSVVHAEVHGCISLNGPIDQPSTAAPLLQVSRQPRRGLAVQVAQVKQELLLQIVEAAEGDGLRQFPGHRLQGTSPQERFATDVGHQVVTVGAAFGD